MRQNIVNPKSNPIAANSLHRTRSAYSLSKHHYFLSYAKRSETTQFYRKRSCVIKGFAYDEIVQNSHTTKANLILSIALEGVSRRESQASER